jgi:hypothetical protein
VSFRLAEQHRRAANAAASEHHLAAGGGERGDGQEAAGGEAKNISIHTGSSAGARRGCYRVIFSSQTQPWVRSISS